MTVPRIWLFAGPILIPLLLVLDAFIYYPALARSGTLRSEADSVGIPIAETVYFAPILMLALALYALPAIYRYRGDARWLTFDRHHPWRLALSTALYALPAAFVAGEQAYSLAPPVPAYEYTILIVTVPLFCWLLLLRAAMAAPLGDTLSEGPAAAWRP